MRNATQVGKTQESGTDIFMQGMTSSSDIRTQASTSVSALPAMLLCVLLLALSFLVWPGFLERQISLEWRLGNMRLPAYTLQALLAGAAAVTGLLRRPINSRCVAMFPSRKHFFFALVAATMSLAVTLAALESACRLLDLPVRFRTARAEHVIAKFDSELGWAYLPNSSVVSSFGSDRRMIPSHFDELGIRVRAPGRKHDPGAPTVLLVGDSFTMGHGVVFEETFAGRLEARPDFPYQVVNLGVQAYGTDQSFLMLKRHFKRWNTKVVVYTFIEDHIVRNSNYDRRMLQVEANVAGTKPLYGLGSNGMLYLRKMPYRFADHPTTPYLWRYLEIAWNRLGPRPSIPLTLALVQEMRRFTEANGAVFLLVYWSGQGAKPTPRPLLFDSMGLEILDTGADAPADWRNWIIPGDGHPDSRAHARVAQLLYQRLREGLGKASWVR
jgi:hypothetical protein